MTVFSYFDDYVEEDLKAWKNLNIRLFKANLFLYSKQAKNALLVTQADVFHMEALWRYPHLLMGVWKKYRQEPIVCSPHGMFDPYIIHHQGLIKRIIAKLFFHSGLTAVDCYHALCLKELEDIRAYGLKQPVAIIPNGVDLPIEENKYKQNDGKHHLLYLGRLHHKKGVDLLLRAIAQIKKDSPCLLDNWIIDVVGWDHENYKSVLEHICQKNILQDIVVFHGGVFGEGKAKMYANASAYILPSHGEGLPMTILEAWSWKLPVVMTPQCNLPEGYAVDAAIKIDDNVHSIKEGLEKLLKMEDTERFMMGQRGYKLVSEQFTWTASAKKMVELYEWLVHKRRKPDFVYE